MNKHTVKRAIWKSIYTQRGGGCLPEWVGSVVLFVIILAVVISFFIR